MIKVIDFVLNKLDKLNEFINTNAKSYKDLTAKSEKILTDIPPSVPWKDTDLEVGAFLKYSVDGTRFQIKEIKDLEVSVLLLTGSRKFILFFDRVRMLELMNSGRFLYYPKLKEV